MDIIKLKPFGKDYLWGGDYLKKKYNKCLDITPLAETWEFSTHPNGNSIVDSGKYQGLTLSELLKIKPSFFGKKISNGELPILIKFIDANKDLSIQVHPSDEYALKHENQKGKTEMWYILKADKDSKIVYGFEYDVTKEMIKQSLKDHTFEQLLHYEKVEKGDCIYIPSGIVHALGKGIVCVEIQESSDVTYRLYDYDRVDASGKKRELHLDKALEVLNYSMQYNKTNQKEMIEFNKEYIIEHLSQNKHFNALKYSINSGVKLIKTNPVFDILLIIEGRGSITTKTEIVDFLEGDCIIIPCGINNYQITGNIKLLKINI